MNCADVKSFVQVYLDGEFVEQERVDFDEHLYACSDCRSLVDVEKRFREKLRSSVAHDAVSPPGLRDRIRECLDNDGQPHHPVSRWSFRLIPVGVTAMLLCGVWFSKERIIGGGAQYASLTPLVEQSVQWHQKQIPLDVRGSKPEPIKKFFRDKLPFAVRPPRFHDPRVKLIGARLSHLREYPAAYLVYQVGDTRLSVFVLGDDSMRRLRGNSRKLQLRGVRGYTVATYVANGTAYTFASDMDQPSLRRLVADAR